MVTHMTIQCTFQMMGWENLNTSHKIQDQITFFQEKNV